MARTSQTPKSPSGIVRYASVFTARQRKDGNGKPQGDPKFGLLLVFNKKTDLSDIEAEVERVATEKFGSKAVALMEKGKINSPIRDAEEYIDEEKDDEENFPFTLPGARMIRFSTKDKPGVVDEDAEPIMDKSEFYDGCEARVSYRAFAYDNNGNKGVGLWLINVQKTADGDKLGGGNPSAEDDFAPVKAKTKAAPAKKARRNSDDDDDLLG